MPDESEGQAARVEFLSPHLKAQVLAGWAVVPSMPAIVVWAN